MSAHPTRRELVRAAAISTAAAGLVGAVPAAAAPVDDAAVLGHVLEIEQLVVIVYRRALASHALTPNVAATVAHFLGQELQHTAILRRAVVASGGAPTPAPPNLTAVQRALARHQVMDTLTDLRTEKQCLKLLVDVETIAEDAYFVAIGKLTDPELLRTSAQIMGCEAQHWTVLSAARHHGDVKLSVPYPFVGGTT